jgi:hypothetical protein
MSIEPRLLRSAMMASMTGASVMRQLGIDCCVALGEVMGLAAPTANPAECIGTLADLRVA